MPIIVNGKEKRTAVAVAEVLINLLKGIISIFLLIPVVVLLKVYLIKPLRYFVASASPDLDQLYKLTKKELLNIIGNVLETLLMIHITLILFTSVIAGICLVIYCLIEVFIK